MRVEEFSFLYSEEVSLFLTRVELLLIVPCSRQRHAIRCVTAAHAHSFFIFNVMLLGHGRALQHGSYHEHLLMSVATLVGRGLLSNMLTAHILATAAWVVGCCSASLLL